MNEFQRMQRIAGLITESQLNEALNKDIKAFGQDLDKKFKEAGFDTLVITQSATPEQLNIVQTNPKAAIFEVSQNPETQMLTLRVNPKMVSKAESIINKFQLSDYNGPVLKKGWTAKQVQGAINPGDIVKQDSAKNNGTWYFYRLAKVDTKVKNINQMKESQIGEAEGDSKLNIIADLYAYRGIKSKYDDAAIESYGEDTVRMAEKLAPKILAFMEEMKEVKNKIENSPEGKMLGLIVKNQLQYDGARRGGTMVDIFNLVDRY